MRGFWLASEANRKTHYNLIGDLTSRVATEREPHPQHAMFSAETRAVAGVVDLVVRAQPCCGLMDEGVFCLDVVSMLLAAHRQLTACF